MRPTLAKSSPSRSPNLSKSQIASEEPTHATIIRSLNNRNYERTKCIPIRGMQYNVGLGHQHTRLAAKTADYSSTLNGNSYESCCTCTQELPARAQRNTFHKGQREQCSAGQGIPILGSLQRKTLPMWMCTMNIHQLSCCYPFVRIYWCRSFATSSQTICYKIKHSNFRVLYETGHFKLLTMTSQLYELVTKRTAGFWSAWNLFIWILVFAPQEKAASLKKARWSSGCLGCGHITIVYLTPNAARQNKLRSWIFFCVRQRPNQICRCQVEDCRNVVSGAG